MSEETRKEFQSILSKSVATGSQAVIYDTTPQGKSRLLYHQEDVEAAMKAAHNAAVE